MTPRADRKLLEVPVARYSFRHEAEFAAGFLDDAGVPYRLQLDDPAMGMTMGMEATIWVRGIDEAWAREVLEHGVQPLDDDLSDVDDDPLRRDDGSLRGDDDRVVGDADWFEADTGPPRRARSGTALERSRASRVTPQLGVRERVLLLVGSALCGAAALFLPGETFPIVGPALGIAAALLALGGILGRVPEPLRRLLRAIAGHAP